VPVFAAAGGSSSTPPFVRSSRLLAWQSIHPSCQRLGDHRVTDASGRYRRLAAGTV